MFVCRSFGGGTGIWGGYAVSLFANLKIKETPAKRKAIMGASSRIYADFKKKYNTGVCKALTGLDLLKTEDMKTFNEKFRPGKCADMLQTVTELLVAELKKIV